MLDHEVRTAVLLLNKQGKSIRAIAKDLGIARGSVRAVIDSGSNEVPELSREEKAEPWLNDILALYASCKGNLVRVHEELIKGRGADISYQGLTAFCRRHEIGFKPKLPSGSYHFEPGEEMQHDTSPHRVKIDGKIRKAECASLVLCHSRMIYCMYFPKFDRFICKAFLTEAFKYFSGACQRCIVDNTSVVKAQGIGTSMVPAPEMKAFSERFGFEFQAHSLGHANRKAHVERGFDYIENNFLAGRVFKNWEDLNQQARAWCEKVNSSFKRNLCSRPVDLFAQEQHALSPLPGYVPVVYQLHHRVVDSEGYVNIHRVRYSVPYKLTGRQVEIRESLYRIDVFNGPRQVASHPKPWDIIEVRVTLPEHRPPRGEGRSRANPSPIEIELMKMEPRLDGYISGLKTHSSGRIALALRRLLGMTRDYPRQPLIKAVDEALTYGMFDLKRLEKMILRNVGQDYFALSEGIESDLHFLEESHER